MKKILSLIVLFVALGTANVCAESFEIEVLAKNASAETATGWTSSWTSSQTVKVEDADVALLKITSTVDNSIGNWENNTCVNFLANHTNAYTYTMTVPTGYLISKYAFDLWSAYGDGTRTVKFTPNDGTMTTPSGVAESITVGNAEADAYAISVDNVNLQETTFSSEALYLQTDAIVVKNFIVTIEYDPTSAIHTANATANLKSGKLLQNGRVVILKNGKQFNIAGQIMK